MELALFPLPICILPGGMTQLRIFEPRYKRLVSDSLSSGSGFVICMLGDDGEPMPVATRVDIIDFETLEDGLLGITVAARERLYLDSWHSEADGLKRGQTKQLPSWPALDITPKHNELALRLAEVFDAFPAQQSYYQQRDFSNLTWVCQRWLELLPIGLEYKQRCYTEDDVGLTLALLEQIFEKD